MSLNNIILPDFVIADLYRRSLIQPSADEGFMQAMPEALMPPPETRIVAESQAVVKTTVKEPVAEKVPEKIIEVPPVKAAEPAAYKILGNNKKQITVVVNCPNDVFVPEADLQFLTKMLGACKLNMADVAIVNHATAMVAIE